LKTMRMRTAILTMRMPMAIPLRYIPMETQATSTHLTRQPSLP
jgi:hypothetical protein